MKRLFNVNKNTILLIVFAITIAESAAIDIPFVPPCYNYKASTYNAGNQNWAIVQDEEGIIYIANNEGLLCFDGANWTLKQLPSRQGIKSIFIDKESYPERIYVGAFEEFGYFYYDEFNQLVYHSLNELLENYLFQNDEIWTINKIDKNIYFQSFSSYFIYDGEKIRAEKPYPAPLYFFNYNNALFAQFIGDNFCHFNSDNFDPILSKSELENNVVIAMLPYNENILLPTANNGIYIYQPNDKSVKQWQCENVEDLKKAVINRAIATDSLYIFGTLNNGVYAMNKQGQLQWHMHINNGLNNNTVLGLMQDNQNNLWLALDNGIAMIPLKSNLSFFFSKSLPIGMVEDLIINDNQLYIASNYGIFKYQEKNDFFTPLPDFNYQTWFIRKFNNQILVGQNIGTSFLENDKRLSIPLSGSGGMDIKQTIIHEKDVLLESTYTNLAIYLKNNNGLWEFSHNINGFSDLIRHLEIDHSGNIWAKHMYKGVYRLNLDSHLKKVVKQEYFQTIDNNSQKATSIELMKLRGRIIFSDEKQFYTFDDIQQAIIPYKQLNDDLPDFGDTYRIISINDTAFWFIRKNEYVLIHYQDNSYLVKDKIPAELLKNPPNKGRRNMYIGEDEITYLCLNEGICKYQPQIADNNKTATLQIASAWSFNNKRNEKKMLRIADKNIIDYKNNNIVFNYQFPDFSHKEYHIKCLLENYDNQWRTTNLNRSITYYNLPAGNYQLKAKVVNNLGETIAFHTTTFHVKKPWHQTIWAYIFYGVFLLSVIILLLIIYIRIILNRRNKSFEKQEKERLIQLEKQEKLITKLKNEKLEADLVYKGKELANVSMLVINHEKLLKQLKHEIQQHILSGKLPHKQGNQLLNTINQNLSDDDVWSLFEENFDLIHENFFRKLQETYPSLTPTDLKLCALLRLNYSSKEIAHMLNLTPRGVEAGRYRLRKKLNLTEDINLVSFMINFN